MEPIIAIVGRPNVGKSTLFNRLVGKKLALVDDTPGVTRDRREAKAKIGDLQFKLIDTAGFEDANDESLEARMREQTQIAVKKADIILFMIDARAGIVPLDEFFAKILRKSGKKIYLLANKAETKAAQSGINETYKLGFGEPIAISAEHGLGVSELYSIIAQAIDEKNSQTIDKEQGEDDFLPQTNIDILEQVEGEGKNLKFNPERFLNIAIIGRPNAGKSTLINSLLGEERLLTGPEAGITRDSIMVNWQWNNREIRLVDTAGIRKRSKVQLKLEKLAVSDALRSIQYAEIVVLLLDATKPFEKQDLHLADLVEREGRALVIALNKWDLIKNKNATLNHLRERCETLLPQLRKVPLIPISGLKGKNIAKLMKAVFEVEKAWNIRLSTAKLNRWLSHMVAAHPPPAIAGRRLKLRYITQVKSRPPTFVLFCSRPQKLPTAYKRYIINGLREDFNMWGIPIRLWLRSGDNPYAEKEKKR